MDRRTRHRAWRGGVQWAGAGRGASLAAAVRGFAHCWSAEGPGELRRSIGTQSNSAALQGPAGSEGCVRLRLRSAVMDAGGFGVLSKSPRNAEDALRGWPPVRGEHSPVMAGALVQPRPTLRQQHERSAPPLAAALAGQTQAPFAAGGATSGQAPPLVLCPPSCPVPPHLVFSGRQERGSSWHAGRVGGSWEGSVAWPEQSA